MDIQQIFLSPLCVVRKQSFFGTVSFVTFVTFVHSTLFAFQSQTFPFHAFRSLRGAILGIRLLWERSGRQFFVSIVRQQYTVRFDYQNETCFESETQE